MKRDHGGNVSEMSRRYGIDEDAIIDFSANINPLGYPAGLRESVTEEFDSILNYPDIDSFDLVSGLSEYHGIDQDSIVVGNGSTEFIYWMPVVFKPRKALIVTPAFSEYEKGLKVVGTEVSYFRAEDTDNFSVDIDRLCERLREGFDMVYLCNPANPTGVLTPKDEVRKVIACARETGTRAVVDEAFVDFVEEESLKEEIFRYSNLIVLRSMTKFFGIPGLRVGYIMAPEPVVKKIGECKPPWSVNSLVQKAVVKVLLDVDYIRNTIRYVTDERAFLTDALNEIPGFKIYGSAANFLLVSIIGLNAPELRDHLAQRGILIRDCSTFQGMGDRYFRVAVKRHDQNVILIEKLREVIDSL
jgi:threonine-phosphate decarboxylase